jgi:hypothetical protein
VERRVALVQRVATAGLPLLTLPLVSLVVYTWQCCVDNDTVRRLGVTFDQFVCLGRCNGAVVESHRASDVSLQQFRSTVIAICGQQPTEKTSFLVSRSVKSLVLLNSLHLAHLHTLSATVAQRLDRPGTAIGLRLVAITLGWTWYASRISSVFDGNLKGEQVLLLDVARFKYPPHWVPLPLLYESMQAIDAATGRCRGYVLMSRSEVSTSLLLTVSRSKLDHVIFPRADCQCAYADVLQVSWHQLAHCLAASAKDSAAFTEGTEAVAAEDALQSTMEMLLIELGAALVPITEPAAAGPSAASSQCCGPSTTTSTSSSDPVCCQEMASPSLFGDDHVAAIHSLRYAVECLPLFAVGQRAWASVAPSHASPFHPPMCAS